MKADLELIEDVKRGDKTAFGELVKRHQSALVRVCTRMTRDEELAYDVVQESFVKAYQKLETFEGRSSFKSWLFQIALNTARNKLRGQRMELVSIDNVQISTSGNAESDMIQVNIRDLLRAEVQKLPDRQRVALELRIYEDLSFQEIAHIMDCPYDTAKANYRHGLLKIKASLEQNEVLRSWSESENSLFTEIELSLTEGDA